MGRVVALLAWEGQRSGRALQRQDTRPGFPQGSAASPPCVYRGLVEADEGGSLGRGYNISWHGTARGTSSLTVNYNLRRQGGSYTQSRTGGPGSRPRGSSHTFTHSSETLIELSSGRSTRGQREGRAGRLLASGSIRGQEGGERTDGVQAGTNEDGQRTKG